jgi:hypothetical protein
MKRNCLVMLTAAWLTHVLAFGVGEFESPWKVQKLSLIEVKEGVRMLTATVEHTPDSKPVEFSDYVATQEIQDSFIWGDRLVLLGEAERASVVEIFDLKAKAKLDWFVCYEPRRVSENWIVYKRHYFTEAQGPVAPLEVLLVYDLARTPLENRMQAAANQRIPAPVPMGRGDNVVEVGIPVYPENNARQRSYQMSFESQVPGRHISLHALRLLPSRKLVFVCAESWPGRGQLGARQYLTVVDLSRGLEGAPSASVELPKLGDDGAVIAAIEPEQPNAVRLAFPKGRYSMDSLVVGLPEF